MLVSSQVPALSSDRLPLKSVNPNHHSSVVRSSSSEASHTSCCSSTNFEDHPAVRKEQHRRKLVGLHHAAFCTHVGHSPCPGHAHCLAHKRIFTHMSACREGSRCIIPGCAKARLIWTHFATCVDAACSICTAIPENERTTSRTIIPQALVSQHPVKSHLPRSPKQQMSRTPMRRPGRPPLSPKPRYDLPPRSPPRSPSPKLP